MGCLAYSETLVRRKYFNAIEHNLDELGSPHQTRRTRIVPDAGLPYWAVIVGTTIAFRVALIPFLVISMKNGVRMQDAKPEMELLNAELRRSGSDVESRTKYYAALKLIQKKHDFSMTRTFLPMFVQMPLFLWFFGSVRTLLDSVPEAAVGGTLWFIDLTARDPFLRLNVLTALVMYISFRIGAESGHPLLAHIDP